MKDMLRIWPSGHGSGGDDIVNHFGVLLSAENVHEGVAFASPWACISGTQACRGHAYKTNM